MEQLWVLEGWEVCTDVVRDASVDSALTSQ